jgi:hypothetical protein
VDPLEWIALTQDCILRSGAGHVLHFVMQDNPFSTIMIAYLTGEQNHSGRISSTATVKGSKSMEKFFE